MRHARAVKKVLLPASKAVMAGSSWVASKDRVLTACSTRRLLLAPDLAAIDTGTIDMLQQVAPAVPCLKQLASACVGAWHNQQVRPASRSADAIRNPLSSMKPYSEHVSAFEEACQFHTLLQYVAGSSRSDDVYADPRSK